MWLALKYRALNKRVPVSIEELLKWFGAEINETAWIAPMTGERVEIGTNPITPILSFTSQEKIIRALPFMCLFLEQATFGPEKK